jgi:3-hydroxybutyrate dehydrogenase
MNYDLSGRAAILTGAAGGIGSAIRTLLEESGAQVLPVDLVEGEGVFQADISTKAGNQAMVAEAVRRFGKLDTLILNAAVLRYSSIVDMPEETWDLVMRVNLKGPMLGLQAAWPYLIAQPDGRAVLTSSIAAFRAGDDHSAYTSAKHGVDGLMKCAAIEGAPHGLLVNAVAPGAVRTTMNDSGIADGLARGLSQEEAEQAVADYMAIHRLIEPREIANAVAFLVSEGASAITGTTLSVDLGARAV